MVFMEKIADVMALATHFEKLLISKDDDRRNNLIIIFHSNIEVTTRVDIIEYF